MDLPTLVKTERDALVAVARSEGLGPEEALDCVQDALCTYLDGDREDVDRPGALLSAIVRNAARNARRRHHHARPHEAIAPDREPQGEGADVESLVAAAEEMVRMRMCVTELCEIQRSVVMLRLLEERSGDDVAATLGVSRGYVDVLVHRARASLRACLAR
jgi:RNA polymerase sigma-70 factor, ECF subfamily